MRTGRAHARHWHAHGLTIGVFALAISAFAHHAAARSATPHPGSAAANPAATAAPQPSVLQQEKLIQEIRQLQISNENASSPWRNLILLAPTLAAAAAVLTFGVGWSTQRAQTRRQKDLDRIQQQADSTREFDTRFAEVVANLGSDSVSLQASAAAILPVYLNDRYAEFTNHIIRVTTANLRLPGNEVVRNLLVEVLGTALRLEYRDAEHMKTAADIDLADVYLRALDIRGVKMREKFTANRADLSFCRMDDSDLWKAHLGKATLSGASLRNVDLGQARLDGADLSHAVLHGCRANSASLRDIDGRYAMFQGAKLQAAHLDNADLRGARFDGANLNDCYFLGAQLDQGALQSILKSDRWRAAHFDQAIRDHLLAGVPASVPAAE